MKWSKQMANERMGNGCLSHVNGLKYWGTV